MDLILGNLNLVKSSVLPAELQDRSTYDDLLAEIARGAGVAMQQYCNRVFSWAEDAIEEFTADRTFISLARYPIIATPTVELRDSHLDTWNDVATEIENVSLTAGLVYFGSRLGSHLQRIRVTSTGGWWYDTEEYEASVQPEGSTLVPWDVRTAWLTQTQHIFEMRDKLHLGATAKESAAATLDLLPLVKQMLEQYRRMS